MKAILQYLQARGFGCASDAAYGVVSGQSSRVSHIPPV